MFSVITSGAPTMTDKIPLLFNLVPPFRAYTSDNVILERVFISARLLLLLLLHSRLLSDAAIQLCRHILIYVKTKLAKVKAIVFLLVGSTDFPAICFHNYQ
jgi:hypothetical protein